MNIDIEQTRIDSENLDAEHQEYIEDLISVRYGVEESIKELVNISDLEDALCKIPDNDNFRGLEAARELKQAHRHLNNAKNLTRILTEEMIETGAVQVPDKTPVEPKSLNLSHRYTCYDPENPNFRDMCDGVSIILERANAMNDVLQTFFISDSDDVLLVSHGVIFSHMCSLQMELGDIDALLSHFVNLQSKQA